MGRTIKEVTKEPRKPRFSERLEQRAREVASAEGNGWGDRPERMLERDIALTLNHINGLRASNAAIEGQLNDLEMYFHTKLMQIWPGKDEHLPYLWREQDKEKLRERERWRERLLELWEERRKLLGSLEEKLHPLHDRILSLLQRHSLLAPEENENGNRETRKKA